MPEIFIPESTQAKETRWKRIIYNQIRMRGNAAREHGIDRQQLIALVMNAFNIDLTNAIRLLTEMRNEGLIDER